MKSFTKLFSVLALLAAPLALFAQEAPSVSMKADALMGTATITVGNESKAITLDSDIPPGSSLRLADNAKLTVYLPGGFAVEISGPAEVKVASMQVSAVEGSDTPKFNLVFELLSGSITSQVGKDADAVGSTITVNHEQTSAETIKGVARVAADGPTAATVEVAEGEENETRVTYPSGPKPYRILTNGQSITVDGNGATDNPPVDIPPVIPPQPPGPPPGPDDPGPDFFPPDPTITSPTRP